MKSLEERFWEKVNKDPGLGPNGECWEWIACIRSQTTGYGAFKVEGKTRDAHRVAYELQIGEITKECICHKCDNRLCVRKEHLFEGSKSENNKDMFNKGRNNPPDTSKAKYVRGEQAKSAKLTEKDVILIREKYEEGTTYKSLAKKFNVSEGAIAFIIRRVTWKHIL